MNILIAPDKFKGSLSAEEVCQSIAKGLRNNYPSSSIQFAPLADGGDGTLTILNQYLTLQPRCLKSCDPLGRPLDVTYLESDDSAFIEVATASGLVLLTEAERNPLLTSTFGTGLQLKDALVNGKQHISLLLGGSATNDLGLGIVEALGYTFYAEDGQQIRPTGDQLVNIYRIKRPEHCLWEGKKITLLCDVDNPLYGPNGAAHVYAAQKGATPLMIEKLERGARQVANVITRLTGISVDKLSGGGAAGGIGAGLTALIGGELTSGFEVIKQLSGLEEKVIWADMVISGEGQIDEQSLQGKVVGGVLALCQKHETACSLFAGRSTLEEELMSGDKSVSISEVMKIAPDVKSAMKNAADYLTKLAQQLIIR